LFVARKSAVVSDDGKSSFTEMTRVGTLEVILANDDWSRARINRLGEGMPSIRKGDFVSPDPIPNNGPLVSNTPLLKNYKKGKTILEDDMQKQRYLSVAHNDGDSYENGKLNISSPLKNNAPAFCFYPSPFNQLQNFILEGEMEFNKLEGRYNYVKIYIRSTCEASKQFKGYALYLKADGQYAVSIDGNEYNNFFIPFTSTRHLNQGKVPNRFRIVAEGSRFDIYVNDTYLVSFEDELYTQGTIGLLAKQGTSAAFSNVSLWTIDKQ